jgi:DNA polymerase III delta prime subunit
MRPTAIEKVLEAQINAGHHRTLLVTSAPGTGKTQVMQQVARRLDGKYEGGFGCLTVHAPTLDPGDVAIPLPNMNRDGVNFVPTGNLLPFDHDDTIPEHGLLIIDEMPQASNDVQKLMAQLIQERAIYGMRLKDGWTIVATGNRQQDKAGANKILKHLADRMTTLEMDVSIDDWAEWFRKQPFFTPMALAFINFRPDLLSAFDPNLDVSPTPRSWAEGVFQAMDHTPQEYALDVFAGAVGRGPAGEFVSFLNLFQKLPDVKKVLANPDKVAVPTENNIKYALVGAIAGSKALDAKTFGNALKFVDRMGAEYGVLLVRSVKATKQELIATKAFSDWAISSGKDVLGIG